MLEGIIDNVLSILGSELHNTHKGLRTIVLLGIIAIAMVLS